MKVMAANCSAWAIQSCLWRLTYPSIRSVLASFALEALNDRMKSIKLAVYLLELFGNNSSNTRPDRRPPLKPALPRDEVIRSLHLTVIVPNRIHTSEATDLRFTPKITQIYWFDTTFLGWLKEAGLLTTLPRSSLGAARFKTSAI